MDFKDSAIIILGLIIIVVIYYFLHKAINKNRKPKYTQPPVFYQEGSKPKRQATPQVLQAYERLTILMERIDIPKLLSRVQPISSLKQDYANYLIQNIEQEFDFNLSQQLYVSEESWALVLTAKNTVIQDVLKTSLDEKIINANDLRIKLLTKSDNNNVVDLAKTRLRKEVTEMM